MAPGLIRWIAAVALGSAALAVAALPPTAPDLVFGQRTRDEAPERIRALELRREVLVAQESLRRLRWVDSLTAVVGGAADRPERIVVQTRLSENQAARVAQRERVVLTTAAARAEMDRMAITRPAVDLGIFALPRQSGAESVVEPTTFPRVEWYAGESGGRPYCIAAHVAPAASAGTLRGGPWDDPEPDPSVLGPCGWFARYGMPGSSIHRWMQGSGWSLSLARGPRPVDIYPAPAWSFFRVRSIESGDLRIEACLKRSADCSRLLLEAPLRADFLMEQVDHEIVAAGLPLLGIRNRYLRHDATSYLLDDVEREFGPVAFARFWRSTEPVEVAFESAFGTTLEGWTLRWARSLEGAGVDVGSMPAGRESGLMLLYTFIGLGLAVSVVSRRQVG